ncbi:aminoglycoside phosphotransferase family protein [Microlunatus sp. GCM10028923]|uniref:aminoglycoside phosphotransferase family protein n=1 Tax=Microlunatus sp. GCM10028923 TaxID=3273400 RepID=UPI003613790C
MVPDRVRARAQALGRPGTDWLDALPGVLAELSRNWSLRLGEQLAGGSTSLVLRARTAEGRSVVLKLSQPDLDLTDQAATLERAAGRGYVRLLASDLDRNALLLDGLGPSLEDLHASPEQTMTILCDTLAEAWRVPRAAGPSARPVPDKATALAEAIEESWPLLGRPCPRRVIDRALEYAERRSAAFDLERSVVAHGDPHPGNALRVLTPRPDGSPEFVFVDPDGFLDDRAYDLGVVLRDWRHQLIAADDPVGLARGYCRLLADRTGVDAEAIWEWGYLERVSTGLYALRHGAPELGRSLLTSAGPLAEVRWRDRTDPTG